MKITVLRNGPLLIQGDAQLVDAAGRPIAHDVAMRFALCRCGHSGNKPFCDGTHATVHFGDPTDPLAAPAPRSPTS